MSIKSIAPEEQVRLLDIVIGDWKYFLETTEVAIVQVHQALSFGSGSQLDVWDVCTQIKALELFRWTSDVVIFFRKAA